MAYPYNQAGEIQKLINLYRARPDLFDSKQIESLHGQATELGINFKPLEQQVRLKKLATQFTGGFVEGFTTIPVADRPRTTYESIARSMGHLAGFAPGILAVPTKGVAALAGKAGLSKLQKGALKTAGGMQKFGEWSIPMIGSRFAKGKTATVIDKAKISAVDTFKVGGIGRQITEEAIGLGVASSISNVWSGGDAMLDGFTSGAVFGGAFGGIGNFVRLGNIFKNAKDPNSLKRAESALKAGIGSTIQGLPSTLRDEPIEMQLYEYLLGGFFGYSARPANQVEGGKFITGLTASNKPAHFFDPTKNPKWDTLSRRAKDYVNEQSTEQSYRYIQRNSFDLENPNVQVTPEKIKQQAIRDLRAEGKEINEANIEAEVRSKAYDIYVANEPQRNITVEQKESLHEEIPADNMDPVEPLPVSLRTLNIANKAFLKYKGIRKGGLNSGEVAQAIERSVQESVVDGKPNVETFISLAKNKRLGDKTLWEVLKDGDVVEGGEKGLRQYYHNSSKPTEPIYVAVFGKNTVNMELSNGKEYNGKLLDKTQPIMPINEFSDIGGFKIWTHIIDKKGDPIPIFKQNPYAKALQYNISDKQLYAIEMNLLKNPNGAKYIYSGVKDKSQAVIADMVDIAEGGARIRINDIYNALSPDNRAKLKSAFKQSQKAAVKSIYNSNIKKSVTELHERKFVSNMLHDANINGLYTLNTKPRNLDVLFESGFGKSAVDINKRMQLYTDSGIPQVKESYANINRLQDGKMNIMVIDEAMNWSGKKGKESDSDGGMYFLPEIIKASVNSMGLPNGTSKIKPVIAGRTTAGNLLTKSNGQEAFGPMLEYMRKNNIDVIIQDSSAKLKGQIVPEKVTYEGKNLVIENPNIYTMNLNNLRINPSTYENPYKSSGSIKVPLQMGGVINTLQNPEAVDVFIDHFVKPSVEGTVKGKELITKDITKVIEALEKDPKVLDEIPVQYIIEGLKERNTPKSNALRKAFQKIRPENTDAEIDLDTDATFDLFHKNNKALFDLAEGLYIPNVVFKTLRRPFESQLRKYILSRYKNPVYKHGGKAWLNSLTPDMVGFFELAPGKKAIERSDIVLDNYHKKTPALYKGEETTLGKLFELHKKDPNNKDIQKALELVVIRVPADSIASVRVLNLIGFSSQKGSGAFTHDFANRYLGGADKDSDSVTFYQNVPEKLKKNYAKEGNKFFDERSHVDKKRDLELRKMMGTDNAGTIETKIESRWSPHFRGSVHKNAITGMEGLGFGLGVKEVFLETAHQIKNNYKNRYKEKYTVKENKKDVEYEIDVRVKDNPRGFFDLLTYVVNTSADASKHARITFYKEYRNMLANELFEGTVKRDGVEIPLEYNHIIRSGKGFKNKLSLATLIINRSKPLKTPPEYPRDQVLEGMERDINSTENVEYGNVGGKVGKMLKKDGIDTLVDMEPLNFDLVLKRASDYTKDKSEVILLNRHVSDLIPYLLLRKTPESVIEGKTSNRSLALDSMSKDLSHISLYELSSKIGLDLYRQLSKNGVGQPKALADQLNKIAYKALEIKNGKDSFQVDALIKDYKDNNIADFARKNKISNRQLNEYFDYWLLSSFQSKRTLGSKGAAKRILKDGEFNTSVWRSNEIQDLSKQNMFRQMDNIYKEATGKVGIGTSEIAAPSFKEVPLLIKSMDKSTINAKDQVDKVPVISKQKSSSLKKKAIYDRDAREIERLEKNMEDLGIGSDFKEIFDIFLFEKTGQHKSFKEINMADLAAFNKYLSEIGKKENVLEVTKKFWLLDPRTLDKIMAQYDKYTRTTMEAGIPGKLKPVKESFSTFGWIQKFFKKTQMQENAQIDKVVSETTKMFEFRNWDRESQRMLMDVLTARRALSEGLNAESAAFETSVLEKNKSFLTKKIEGKTGEEWVQIYDKKLTKFFEEFGNKWIYITTKEKGKDVRVNLPTDQSSFAGLNVNKNIRYDKSGRFDFNHFLKTVITQADYNKPTPIIGVESLLRFQYEYQLDKAYKKGDYIEHRKKWTKKNPFQEIGARDAINYFPRTNHGKDKGSMQDYKQSLENIRIRIQNDPNLSPKQKDLELARFDYKYSNLLESSVSKSGKLEAQFLDFTLDNIGYNNRPANTLHRGIEYIAGYDRSPEVLDSYQNKIIRSYYKNLTAIYGNYRIDKMLEKKPFDKNITQEQLKKLKESGYESQTEVFADYLKLYLRDSLGQPSRFTPRIINSMSKGDPLSLKKTPYYFTSDYYIAKQLEKLYTKLDKKKWVNSFPFLNKAPEGKSVEAQKAREEYFIRKIHDLGHLEAKYNLLTLLANTGSMVANIYGGGTMTISSGGLRNFINSKKDSVVTDRLLKNQKGEWSLKMDNGKAVTSRKELIKWLTEKGIIESYIRNEFDYNPELKASIARRGKDGKDFIKQVTKILTKDINAPRETILQLANRYGLKDAMLKSGGWFMQKSERINRIDAFITHALQAQERFSSGKSYPDLSDPAIFEAGLKGIEATQFLYHSAFRPAFMRTAMGKVLTRFKLFAFQSVRTRKEFAKEAAYYGFKEGTEAYEKFKTLYTLDLMGLALGSAFAFSLFDTALPPPWDWLQQSSELIFGDKQERENAFWGTLPRPIAPLQIAIPPSARIPQAMGQLINGDWERFADYTVHTMYPFGRLYRQIDKTIEDPTRIAENFTRLPVNKVIYRYKRAQQEERRKEKIEEVLG